MNQEQWKAVEDYTTYEVSDRGNVRNIKFGRPLLGNKDKDGYCQVMLNEKAKPCLRRVHRMVAAAFLENPKKYNIVDHIDGNKDNNNMTNLRYCTVKQNNMNSKKKRGSLTSKYKGVSFNARKKYFTASIMAENKRHFLGGYQTENEAGYAYNAAARHYFKEFAVLNTIII